MESTPDKRAPQKGLPPSSMHSQSRRDSWGHYATAGPGSAITHFWSLHSGRNFLPTAASVLGAPTQDKDLLGGSSAEGSERYKRLAKYKIAEIKRDVIHRAWDKDALDPLAESGPFRELTEFPRAQRTDESEITRSTRLLGSRRCSESVRPPSAELFPVDSQLGEFLEIDEDLAERKATSEKLAREKQQVWNNERTRKLGENPKAYLADLRASL